MGVKSELKYQYLAGACVNIITISYGAFCGWPSASFLELQSDDSPFETGPMSNDEAGWVGSMICLGGALGTILFSWCSDRIGRKRCLLLMVIPSLIGWLIVPFARNPLHLCISRFLGGIAGAGCFTVVPVYTTELAEDRVRGTLGTFLMLSFNLGILCAFVIGTFYPYDTAAWILSTLTVLFLLCFTFLPETPKHFANKNKMEKAEKSLRYFRNIRSGSKELPLHLKSELEKLQFDEKKTTDDDSILTWKDFTNHTALKAIGIGLALMALTQFCGCFAMINYTASIFQEAGSHLSPNVAAIVVAVIQLFGSYISTILVERAGRKLLLTISATGAGLGHICFGTFSYLTVLGYNTHDFAWVPVASFSFVIFIACWGVLSLPYLVLSEIMPPKIRNVASMCCMSIAWMFGFFMLKYLPLMTELLGMHGLVFTFGSCCFIGAAFIIVCVPETKGKSIETILAML